MNLSLIDQYKAARQAGVPLLAISTPDPAGTIAAINAGTSESVPLCAWDACRGWLPVNDAGAEAIRITLSVLGIEQDATINAVESLIQAAALPDKCVLFICNAHRGLMQPEPGTYIQAVWNLRDPFKTNFRTLVLLGPSFEFPPELVQDIVELSEPLPDDLANEQTVLGTLKGKIDAGLVLEDQTKRRAVDLLRGLSSFAVEQVTAMSFREGQIDLEILGARKEQMISNSPGLALWRPEMTFDDLGGCDAIKGYLTQRLKSVRLPLRAIVWVDEGEKMFAGSTAGTGDSSGVSQNFLGTLLSEMQDRKYNGAIFYGHPGTAKSAIAKASGSVAELPVISLNLSAMKSSLVGSSEANLRAALKTVAAVAGEGGAYWIMTCNKVVDLPSELQSRFKSGIWFFDLPTAEEREPIWNLYKAKYGLKADKSPLDSNGWTGREIENCCAEAYALGCTIAEAAKYIVPIAVSGAKTIEQRRNQAHGTYLSAAYPGYYQLPSTKPTPKGRSLGTGEL